MTDLNDELYHQKYLKYKQKYLQLKKIKVQSGGDPWESYEKKLELQKKGKDVNFTQEELCAAYIHGIRNISTIGACYGLNKINKEERDEELAQIKEQKGRREQRYKTVIKPMREKYAGRDAAILEKNREKIQRLQQELEQLQIEQQQIEQREAQNPNLNLILEINVLQQRILQLELQKYDKSGNLISENLKKLDPKIAKLEEQLEKKEQELDEKRQEEALEKKKKEESRQDETLHTKDVRTPWRRAAAAEPIGTARGAPAAAEPIGTAPGATSVPNAATQGAAAAADSNPVLNPAQVLDPESDEPLLDLEINKEDVEIYKEMPVDEIIEYINQKIDKIKSADRALINGFNKSDRERYLKRNRVIFQSLLEKINTLQLSIFLKKIYQEKINSENVSNDFELRKYELYDEINKLNENLRKLEKEKEKLQGQIKPSQRHFFGSPSEPTENIKIKEDIKIIDDEIRNKQEEIKEKEMSILILRSDPSQNTEQLKQLVIELKHRIDKYIAHKMMIKRKNEFREQLTREREITAKIRETIDNPDSSFFGTNWQKTVKTLKSILDQYSLSENAEDADDVILPADIETSLPEIDDADVESGKAQLDTHLAQTAINLERTISISVQPERQNSVDIREAQQKLIKRLQRLKEIIDVLRQKIQIKNREYDAKKRELKDRKQIMELKIKRVIKLNKLDEDIEKINKEIEHIENLLKLINNDEKHVNTVKTNLKKYCFPILYQEFDNIYNLESVRNIIQQRIPGFNITERVERASSETPLTVERVKSVPFLPDYETFTIWLKQKKGIEYTTLTTGEIEVLYKEFKELSTYIPRATGSAIGLTTESNI